MNDAIANELLKQLTSIAGDLHALVVKETRFEALNLFRLLEDYPAFDWSNEIPGCRIVAKDKYGPTEVSYEGHTYRRYRSSEDDNKGIDIRYRCVISGTVAEKNMIWATLIKFGEERKVKPLNSAVREKIEERQAMQSVTTTVAPPTLHEQFAAAHKAVLAMCGNVPMQYQPEANDNPEDYKRKLAGLQAIIDSKDCGQKQRSPEESAAFAKACKSHADLIQWADQHHVEYPAALRIQPADDTLNVEMKVSTLTNLCGPSKAQAAGMRQELDHARKEQPRQPDLIKGTPMTPDQVRTWIAQRVSRGDSKRYNNIKERGAAVEAINNVTDGKASMVVRKLFNAEIDQLNSAQTMAMYEWVKPAKITPAGGAPAVLPSNVNAAAEMSALLSESK